ncbi:hypothetical protein LTR84_010029 [Exophiala bonariae]|uniref:SUN domain-containing protein n=1 Tax=Exophiala bonariae TaxID=1690606 RepID=A0AAV9NML4_9EURO|nr:hypothetical protein LTR84_010029 [Exophiala bonariae]
MPPRRSSARAASATPISNASPAKRSARGGSLLTVPDSIRRTARGASQQPASEVSVNNPRLPEVQIQQSYAYGSSKTPVLPTQLIARSRMNLKELADNIDAGVEQAQHHLQNHLEEAHANLQNDARAERAERRASREASVASDDNEKNKNQRVAAWANSLDSSQLDEIPEEDSSDGASNADGASRKDTDPSSFPSGIFDHSYNYERGLRRPNITIKKQEPSIFQRASTRTKDIIETSRQSLSRISNTALDWTLQFLRACSDAVKDIPNSPIIAFLVTMIFGLVLASVTGFVFCYTYSHHVCDPLTSSPIGLALQKYCGSCVRDPMPSMIITSGHGEDFSKLTSAINSINGQLRSMDARLSGRIESEHAAIDKDFEALRKQHAELANQLSRIGAGIPKTANDVASPVIAKINYFAPNNGAIVDPRFTSPTKEKQIGLLTRVLLKVVGSRMYKTKGPDVALQAWQDVGDNWCASAVPSEQDSMRLGVKASEIIYPFELVVENYPNAGSISPRSIPKNIELWADFSHLDSLEWEKLGIRHMQGSNPFGSNYALIGQARYDASGEAPHVQTFTLDINQDQYRHHAQKFVVRVVSNHGSDHTCLYRVRLHGISMNGPEK